MLASMRSPANLAVCKLEGQQGTTLNPNFEPDLPTILILEAKRQSTVNPSINISNPELHPRPHRPGNL